MRCYGNQNNLVRLERDEREKEKQKEANDDYDDVVIIKFKMQ